MRLLPSSLPALLLGSGVLSALLVGLPAATAADVTAGAPDKQSSGTGSDRARRALDEAQALFEGAPSRPATDRDATLVLRDLVLTRSSLTGDAREAADRLLARPTDGNADPGGTGYQPGTVPKKTCTTVCVHWVETSSDASTPAYVDLALDTMTDVHATYTTAGYRAPKSDGALGGDAKPDIYLADIGDEGLYGYCTSDDDTVPSKGPYNAWAYCVLDNDYSASEFPTNTPAENLQVTAAHEYFHAIQFGYDLLEDAWFMEATATWAEDELYDGVDDNVQYLSTGPLSFPGKSLDTFGKGFHYGTWVFFRYLTERYDDEVGGMPTLVRDMWALADGAEGQPDQYSIQAVSTVLKERGTSLSSMFALFADGNLRPGVTYAEGGENSYPTAPYGSFVKKDGWFTTKLDHLSSSTAFLKAEKGYTRVRLAVDMPPKATGSAAVVSLHKTDGTVETKRISLDRKGNGSQTYPFNPISVKRLEVTFVNASTKYNCWSDGAFSCQGKPVHDDLVSKVRATLVR